MLITEYFVDLQTPTGQMRVHVFHPPKLNKYPGVAVFTEIYQVTGPVQRFCRQICSQGYIVATPESYHEFLPLGHVIPYDTPGTDLGNKLKIEKSLKGYDDDSKVLLDYLESLSSCTGSLGATGMCLGGHLAYRCAFDKRVKAAVCYFPTDIHKESLSSGSDSLERTGEIKGELLMIFGKQDTHIPQEGRLKIYTNLVEKNVLFSWCEFQAQHAFIRDESTLAENCFQLLKELFFRRLYLGSQEMVEPEHVC
ncbi:hypothetical protein HDV04_000812 [Boothiomyces sp. JEL0838]|nr:hypothetical protein HDV04_000812 [Boothiomyces sp. JEL0838]